MGEGPNPPGHPHADPSLVAVSNGVYLTVSQWLGVGVFVLLLLIGAPIVWKLKEPLELEPDYRLPHELGQDYWLYDRLARQAANRFDTILLGDSVVWGEYVRPDETLSHHLNQLSGSERCGNLGLDGAHPVALAGLIEHYGTGIRDRQVLVQWNPLWLSSPRHALQSTEEFSFNHPRLVPQFSPPIPSYKEQLSPRIGIAIEQRVPFSAWTSHLQQAYYGQSDIPSWTLEHPYENPLAPLAKSLPAPEPGLRHEAIDWKQRGMKPQAFDWVSLDGCLQWEFFQKTLVLLRGRGNRVVVLAGPFNEHALTPENRAVYRELKNQAVAWFESHDYPVLAPEALPSELYADACHPLADGYALLARQLGPILQASRTPRAR